MINSRKLFFSFFIFLLVCKSYAQRSNPCCAALEDSLRHYGKLMLQPEKALVIEKSAARFRELLFEALSCESSFRYPFDSLTMVSKLQSPDKKFRLLNWQYRKNDGKHVYYCFIQLKNPSTRKYDLLELTDNSVNIDGPESRQLDAENWFGALYYQMIPVKVNGKRYYTLLGMKWKNNLTTQKVIEVMGFNDKNQPVFGESIFKYGKLPVRRIVFEFSAQASMLLRYEPKKKYIVWEHLSPTHSHLTGSFQFYGPDGSYDAMHFNSGKWIYTPDVDARNGKHKDTSKNIRKTQPEIPYMKHERE